jgi:hypothetical protein
MRKRGEPMTVNELISELQKIRNLPNVDGGNLTVKLEFETFYKCDEQHNIEDVYLHEWYDSKTKKEYKTVILVERQND